MRHGRIPTLRKKSKGKHIPQWLPSITTLSKAFLFLLGIIIGYQMKKFHEIIYNVNTSEMTTDNGGSTSKDVIMPIHTDGWSPVHVYYGESDHSPETVKDGQTWFAQTDQDKAVLEILKNKRNGYFVDLAANDAVDLSNTLALERSYGWTGLCIEPNSHYWFGLSSRKCHVVGSMVGKHLKEEVMARFDNLEYGGIVNKDFANKDSDKGNIVKRYTTPLKHIFEEFDTPKVIDYLSLDVEGAEEFIMGDFPFEKYTFLVMTVERPSKILHELLKDNGYQFVRMLSNWGETLYVHKSLTSEGGIKISGERPRWRKNVGGNW